MFVSQVRADSASVTNVSTAWCGPSGSLKSALPLTNTLAPAAAIASIVVTPMPPST